MLRMLLGFFPQGARDRRDYLEIFEKITINSITLLEQFKW